jgi:hypothetical protein
MFAVIAQLTVAPANACGNLTSYRYITTEVNILCVLPNPALMEGIIIANTVVDVRGQFCVTFTAIATLTVYDMSPDTLLLAKHSFSV